MTSLLLESFAMPRSARDANAFGTAEERAGDVLAGRLSATHRRELAGTHDGVSALLSALVSASQP